MNTLTQFPRVSVVILNYNNFDFLSECIKSLVELDYPKDLYEIIVVDNASTDSSVEYISKNFPFVKIVKNSHNVGFARGNNIGIKNCDINSKYIALVNNDSKVSGNWLKELALSMELNDRAGCCGAREESTDKGISIERGEFKGNWIGGGSVIYRKKALDEVGLFDELYFAYCEDIDLSWRLKLKGWKITHNENAVWYHYGAGREVKINDKRIFLSMRNRIYLILKFGSISQISRSLWKYVINFILGRKGKYIAVSPESFSYGAAEKTTIHKKLHRIFLKVILAIKIILNLIFRLPLLLIKRAKLKIDTSVSNNEIDRWIDEIDEELFQAAYNF